VARLALATSPSARRIWVAAGPGNNGGDGLVTARHLHQAGLAVHVSLLGDARRLPADAAHALDQARQAGVAISPELSARWPDAQPGDLAIDALLGLGATRPPEGALAEAVRLLNAGTAPVLAVDLPTGLCGDTGRSLGDDVVRAAHTLALLTLKPGLFTAQGRDHAGQIWCDTLGVTASPDAACAWLGGPRVLKTLLPPRAHAQHKGSFGDLLVLGGAPGMGGAALLAARAALSAGAGRVYLARLDGQTEPDAQRPELMPRNARAAMAGHLLARTTVVCGCGGGSLVADLLPEVLARAAQLVLDADGLNAVAGSRILQQALQERSASGRPTVMTPHPLEAARLLGLEVGAVLTQRQLQAQVLADRFGCCVVLKGSGTIVAAPGKLPVINPTGNARLGSAGSGDVLAGWLGGLWSQAGNALGHAAACASVWLHGRAAESGDARLPMRAADLIDAMAATLPD
jgi:hydroxyethylthiazole kinase-like uncharacterized protein yjeF